MYSSRNFIKNKYPDKEDEKVEASIQYDQILVNKVLSQNKNEYYVLAKMKDDKYNDTYLTRLEEEAKTKKIIGEKLETCMFAYPNTLQHYIDLFWECGSIVGAGRGSSCSGLNHYLLGIT